MNKNRLLLFSFFVFSIFLATSTYANEYKFDRNFSKVGYEEIDEALAKSEEHFKRNIALPNEIPITFTHSFGRFSNPKGDANDRLEVRYVDENAGANDYSIEVRPIDYKIPIREEMIDEELKLNNGTYAIYSTTMSMGTNNLVFEMNEWQYILSLNKDATDKALELLIEVANSID
ncbi:hypothetical protein JOD29_002023 [Lysinibacillus composti]|uniref:DUF4367 domain-containing protein n=1 Tax=Lysinibacillus composti TaxID=720633 RepID=A0A3N9UEJ5_9BACI|nr:hypothetical protein [Lysinibacillus composti]MBM7608776.1 hypothetical protein [Lysinibacillus composti]RQW74679.1 hypothetical protein EBB45_10655 [Lysinibacillus composti]